MERIYELNQIKLWEGCMLAAVAHAVMVGEYPELVSEHSWDGMNYNVQDLSGCKGTITFSKEGLVGVFQSAENINLKNYTVKKVAELLEGADEPIMKIAHEESLQYVLEDVNGEIIPVISTAFWGSEKGVYGRHNYHEFIKKGGYILSNQLKSIEESIKSWSEYYDMNNEQVAFTEKIFNKKLLAKDNQIMFTEEETSTLVSFYGDELDDCIESFKEINIII